MIRRKEIPAAGLAHRVYKIVEDHGEGCYRSLFHGIPQNGQSRRSRKLPVGPWLPAEKIEGVRDGTSKTTYTSGWHVLRTWEQAYNYMARFKNRRDKLRIVPVLAMELRPKEHSNAEVYLADRIQFDIHPEALDHQSVGWKYRPASELQAA